MNRLNKGTNKLVNTNEGRILVQNKFSHGHTYFFLREDDIVNDTKYTNYNSSSEVQLYQAARELHLKPLINMRGVVAQVIYNLRDEFFFHQYQDYFYFVLEIEDVDIKVSMFPKNIQKNIEKQCYDPDP